MLNNNSRPYTNLEILKIASITFACSIGIGAIVGSGVYAVQHAAEPSPAEDRQNNILAITILAGFVTLIITACLCRIYGIGNRDNNNYAALLSHFGRKTLHL